MLPSFPIQWRTCLVVAALGLLVSCGPDAVLPSGPGEVLKAKVTKTTSTSLAVSSVDPAYGEQGAVNMKVRIVGSGFTSDSWATWERDGAADPNVQTNATHFISSTELEADVTIAADADLDFYDVAVTVLGTGKKGVGMEMFEVTTAESIGTLGGHTNSYAINDPGQVVGYSVYNNAQHGFFWERATGMQSLGPGIASDIATDATVVGTSGDKAVLWTRVNGAWSTAQGLPSSGLGGAANGVASDENGNAVLIVGGNSEKVGKSTIRYAALWKKLNGQWELQPRLPTPSGYSSGSSAVNRNGQIVGSIRRLSGSTYLEASVWEPTADGSYQRTTLAALPSASRNTAMGLNERGDLVVGMSDALPVYWQKTSTGWTSAQRLAIVSGSCSNSDQYAGGVNNLGWIVGRTCDGSATRATLWRGPTAPREDLGSLGFKSDVSVAAAVNDAPSPVIAGHSPGRNGREAVIWQFTSSSQ